MGATGKSIKDGSRKLRQAALRGPGGGAKSAAGGELHQIAGGSHPPLTTNQGVVVSDNQNSLRGSQRGPT
ncbi:MAG: hypothetical protein ACXW2R_00780, partial [Candidatus Aminicenantales bacterium]